MKKDYRKKESRSPLETLRIERTKMSQADFAAACGIPLRTYQRMVYGETEGKLSARQLKKACQVLGIGFIEELPDDFGLPEDEE